MKLDQSSIFAAAVSFCVISAAVFSLAITTRDRLTSAPVSRGVDSIAIPDRVGDWVSTTVPVDLVNPWVDDGDIMAVAKVYDQLLARSYRRGDGATVMFVIAYKKKLTQEDRIHRPELCYYAQGYRQTRTAPQTVMMGGASLPLMSFLAEGRERSEQVLYWIRTDSLVSEDPIAQRWQLLKANLDGRQPDGVLVRVSGSIPSNASAEEINQQKTILRTFVEELLRSVSPSTRRALTQV